MPNSSMVTVNNVAKAAQAAGYQVTRSQSNGRLSLNITRKPGLYEYVAHFRVNESGRYSWWFAQHIIDGEDNRIFIMRRFLEGLKSASVAS
jgi:hypothetical protein